MQQPASSSADPSDPARSSAGCSVSPRSAPHGECDEPTNHLDLPSAACLAAALDEAGCALLLVSHDADLLAPLVDLDWRIECYGDGARPAIEEAAGARDQESGDDVRR